MTSASTVSHSIRETAKDTREGVRENGKAAGSASRSIERDLQSLRDDFSRLAEQVGDILADKGSVAWRRAKSSVDGWFRMRRIKVARRPAPCATCRTISLMPSMNRSRTALMPRSHGGRYRIPIRRDVAQVDMCRR